MFALRLSHLLLAGALVFVAGMQTHALVRRLITERVTADVAFDALGPIGALLIAVAYLQRKGARIDVGGGPLKP
ncbi:MAG TPA: hypothetical protein VGG33_16295 [Polyangia bacterium]